MPISKHRTILSSEDSKKRLESGNYNDDYYSLIKKVRVTIKVGGVIKKKSRLYAEEPNDDSRLCTKKKNVFFFARDCQCQPGDIERKE